MHSALVIAAIVVGLIGAYFTAWPYAIWLFINRKTPDDELVEPTPATFMRYRLRAFIITVVLFAGLLIGVFATA